MSGGNFYDLIENSLNPFSYKYKTIGRILYNVPCSVCHDNSSGKHYSVYACDG